MNAYASGARSSRVLARLAESLPEFVDETVAVRGSLARGDSCKHSDIDLVLIGRQVDDDERLAMIDHLAPLSASLGRAISLDGWSESARGTIEFWLGAFECRFLAGDRRLFAMHRQRWNERLRALPIESLFTMRTSDPRRCWYPLERDSPLGMNLKRAPGGFVDAHFVSLLCRALRLRGAACDDCGTLFQESRDIAARLLAVRSALHAFASAARESAWFDPVPAELPSVAWPPRVAALMDRQHALIASLERRFVWTTC